MEPLIVYIIGDNRSGSTLLDYLLSCHPKAVSVGELHHLNDYYCKKGIGIERKWKCSCGKPIDECKFWNKIIDTLSFTNSFETKLQIAESRWSFLIHPFHKRALANTLNRPRNIIKGKSIVENYWKIYHTVLCSTDKSIIIDSSKNPFLGYYLYRFQKEKIKFLLLERNLKAVAYSKMNRINEIKQFYDIKDKSISRYLLNSYKVLWRNRKITELIKEIDDEQVVKTISYYELCNDSKRVMSDICSFLEIEKYTIPMTTGQYVYPPHILGGSPSRYKRKIVSPDQRWELYYKNNKLENILGSILQNASNI